MTTTKEAEVERILKEMEQTQKEIQRLQNEIERLLAQVKREAMEQQRHMDANSFKNMHMVQFLWWRFGEFDTKLDKLCFDAENLDIIDHMVSMVAHAYQTVHAVRYGRHHILGRNAAGNYY